MGCWAHDCHSAIGHALKLFRSGISGCISFSLMQRQRGVQECLRHCIADELRARAIAQVGMLPPDNSHELTQHRNRVLEVLQIPEVRKIRLQAFFKGDIRTQGIDVYLPADTPDINQALDDWSVAASWALYPKAIKVF